MYYAQIDADGICYAVTQTAEPVKQGDMIEIDSYDVSLLGKRYNAETEDFEPVPEREPVIPEPTEQELVNAELLLGQAILMENQAAIEETAALILLETVGGGL